MVKIGQKIELLEMENDPNPIPRGTRGVVVGINSTCCRGELSIEVIWENGRTLNLLYPEDKFREID